MCCFMHYHCCRHCGTSCSHCSYCLSSFVGHYYLAYALLDRSLCSASPTAAFVSDLLVTIAGRRWRRQQHPNEILQRQAAVVAHDAVCSFSCVSSYASYLYNNNRDR